MTDREFAELLTGGHETRGVEFKGPGLRSDSHLFAKVVRAILGMANTRDGGRVIIGVDDTHEQLVPAGLTPDQFNSWNYDDIVSGLAPYTDPTVTIYREVQQYNSANYLVIRVAEFEEIPILCNKQFDNLAGKGEPVLRKGACYVRSRRKPETSEIPSQEDMRELLNLAIDKGVRRFVTRSYNVGLPLKVSPPPTDTELFERQLGDLA